MWLDIEAEEQGEFWAYFDEAILRNPPGILFCV
jgi:hypothetical protein